MDSNGRESPDLKNSARSRSRSPIGGGDSDRHSSRGRARNRSRERQPAGNRRNAAIACRRVYIANIPFDAKWTDIKDLFKEKVGDVGYVQLFEDESGKFRGCGVVELKESSSVQKAIDILHRYEFRGRKLVIKEDYELERDKSGHLIPGTGSASRGDRSRDRSRDGYGGSNTDMVSFNTYGLSPQFLDSLGINGPLSSKVFIANLDFKVTAKKLNEVFKLAGKIIHIDLKVDNEGNSKGHGIVEFEHPVEAVQAISMFNHQKLYQRVMSVRMDRYDGGDDDPRSNKLPSGLSGLGKGLGANGQAIHLSGLAGGLGVGGTGGGGGGAGSLPSAALGMMGGAGFGVNPMAAAAAAMSAGIGATGLGAMGLGSGLGTGLASGLGSGLGGSGLTAGAGLNTAGLGLGLGNSNLGSAAERGLLGSSLGASLGSGLSLGSNSGLGLGSSGTSGLNFGLGATGNNNSGSGGLMAGGSSLSSLGNSSALAAAMGNAGSSLGGSGGYGDYGSAYDRAQGGAGNTSGSGDHFGTSSSDTVQVRNLPANYSWQNLRDRFRDVGDVRYTELKSRGTAFIRFNSARDAQRAVDLMNGTRIEGRPIEVRLY